MTTRELEDEDVVFGDFAKPSGTSTVKPGIYPAIIESVSLSEETKRDRQKNEDYTQKYATVFFRVKTASEIAKLRRKFPMNWGKVDDTTVWTDFLAAVTGISSRDKSTLQKVRRSEILEKRVQVVVKNGNPGYVDITEVMAPPNRGSRPTGIQEAPPARREPPPPPPPAHDIEWGNNGIDDSELPF
jgi:hypothetical protein